MPIRNPFARRPDIIAPIDDNARPISQNGTRTPAFERVDTHGSKTSALSIRSEKSEPAEYKLSVVNDSGVYLPPSPPEKKGLWPRRSNAALSNNTRNSEDIEQFSISRESFDSYRRSFDVSARSPVIHTDNGRQSLDSARLPRLPRSAIGNRNFDKQPPTTEEGFEDVGLNDENKQAKKRGFFSKFGESTETGTQSSTGRFHIGRKRGQSGTGQELGDIKRPETPVATTLSTEAKN
ncbi:hypothetical protein B0O99DRAFT_268195 [Bisporella sp. PMI_857]|nr:hypothetical protein B0O99DRAFT_268195 [Bisporella sp. PMI_857]